MVARLLRFGLISALALCAISSRAAVAAPTFTVQPVPTLGGSTSSAASINDAGIVVGAAFDNAGIQRAILFTGGESHDVGSPAGAVGSFATGINNAATIVGTASFGSPMFHNRAFIRTGAEPIDIGTLGGDDAEAAGINNHGQITGNGVTASGDRRAFLYDQLKLTDLGTLGSFAGASSYGRAINDSGVVVGFSDVTVDSLHAFKFAGGKMTDLGTLGGTRSDAYGINGAGDVVGQSTLAGDGEPHAFVFSNGAMSDLGTLGGTYSAARDINDTGTIVGLSTVVGDDVPHGFVLLGGKMYDLLDLIPDAAGWSALSPLDVNNAGQIVGSGFFEGSQRGFVLTPGADSGGVIALPAGVWGGLGLLGVTVGMLTVSRFRTRSTRPF